MLEESRDPRWMSLPVVHFMGELIIKQFLNHALTEYLHFSLDLCKGIEARQHAVSKNSGGKWV
jgi:hypothetical protein